MLGEVFAKVTKLLVVMLVENVNSPLTANSVGHSSL